MYMEVKEIALEIGNDLIKTLDSSMQPRQADSIVRACAERLIREIGGLKGSIKAKHGCILYKDGHGSYQSDYKFVEE